MNKVVLSIVIVSSLLLCPLIQAGAANEWTEMAKLNFGMDDKDWNVGWSDHNEDHYMMEFVPKGQTVNDWKELVTYEFMPGLQKQADASIFSKVFIKGLKESEPKARVSILAETPDNTIIEWVVNGSVRNLDQDELVRIIRGKQGIHILHYVKKTQSLTENERTKWLKFLDSAKLGTDEGKETPTKGTNK